MSKRTIIEARNIRVEYPNVVANNNVSFELKEGEIHGLLGENGAGKTTLVNVIYGIREPDAGELYLFGDRIKVYSPKIAQIYGLYMIPQHSILVERHTVLENIIMAVPGFRMNLGYVKSRVDELVAKLGLDIDLDKKVYELSMGEKQRTEAIRALVREAKVLIMDEPTSVLSPAESYSLFEFIRKLKEEGVSVIFITHRLKEVMDVCDRVTVLRKGRKIATLERSDMDVDRLTEYMFGRKIVLERYDTPDVVTGKTVLSLVNVYAKGTGRTVQLENINLEVHIGEVVGIVGVAGNGLRELSMVASGLLKPSSGRIYLDGIDVTGKSVDEYTKLGLAHIPDNILDGLVLNMDLVENAILKLYMYPDFSKNHIIDWERAEEYTSNIIDRFDVKTSGLRVQIKSLSGGNLQRFILSRELSLNPRVIVAVHPSRGLDLESTSRVLGFLAGMKKSAGVLLITEDLDEAIKVCDKILIIYKGRLSRPIPIRDLNYEAAGGMMAGAIPIEETS